jgi:hypothetical protein
MATTTNYSWTTPDDTALVKDGAAAIRSLGSAVDTTVKALNPSTTLGDIEYRSSTANTNTRLGIGTTGQVLSVSGGVPAWVTSSSGGMTLLSTTTLSGASTTISGISGSYNDLLIVGYGLTGLTSNGYYRIAANGQTNRIWSMLADGASTSVTARTSTYLFILGNPSASVTRTSTDNAFSCTINNYANASNNKPFSIDCGIIDDGYAHVQSGLVGITDAITSLVITFTGGNLNGGTILVYGVK